MWKKAIIAGVIILFGGLLGEVHASQISISKLVRNLLKIGYPLDQEDVLALDKIGMRFNSKNRISVLKKILQDRDSIHSRKEIDFFVKTEVICDALRLLDEHDLPVVSRMVDEFNKEEGWEKREKALLAYMAAKRDIRYQSNSVYLLSILHQYKNDLDRIYSGETSQAIIDIMNCLSYLSDLFVYKGDNNILNSLFLYSSKAYGFPSEYLSYKFVEMFNRRPKVFISTLAAKDDRTVNTVISSLIFGLRRSQAREIIEDVLKKDLFTTEERNQLNVDSIITQIDLAIHKAYPTVQDPYVDPGK